MCVPKYPKHKQQQQQQQTLEIDSIFSSQSILFLCILSLIEIVCQFQRISSLNVLLIKWEILIYDNTQEACFVLRVAHTVKRKSTLNNALYKGPLKRKYKKTTKALNECVRRAVAV